MAQIFGNFREILPTDHEFLLLGFSSSSLPMQNRWRNNGLSANFIADYLSTFFPTKEGDDNTFAHHADVKSSVSYIANELLENAMKFNIYDVQFPIRFGLHLLDEDGITIVLSTTNCVSHQSVASFQGFIQELLTADLDELYVRQLERSDGDESLAGSGLGFITIKNDYNAQLGWKFEEIEGQETDGPETNGPEGAIAVTTMVQLKA
ncbi:MAG: ATP-binding protein [Merismopedia sp. SIO2A8]|nr:ATP-binding protein [Merismopedia sp. SIO2A8]